MTIGTGSDGSGSITGTLFARTQIAAASNNTSTQNKCFGSAATNRVNFAMFLDVNTLPIWFALERTKTEGTTTGADSGDGLILAFGGSTASHKSQVLPFGATAPTAEDGIQCILSRNNPTAYTGDQGIGLMIPILGVAKQPGYNVAVTMGNDFASRSRRSRCTGRTTPGSTWGRSSTTCAWVSRTASRDCSCSTSRWRTSSTSRAPSRPGLR
jgi:hypothetical protein